MAAPGGLVRPFLDPELRIHGLLIALGQKGKSTGQIGGILRAVRKEASILGVTDPGAKITQSPVNQLVEPLTRRELAARLETPRPIPTSTRTAAVHRRSRAGALT